MYIFFKLNYTIITRWAEYKVKSTIRSASGRWKRAVASGISCENRSLYYHAVRHFRSFALDVRPVYLSIIPPGAMKS